MHIAIVGPGALGCLLASLLSRSGQDGNRFSLIDYNSERAAKINVEGIRYRHGDTTCTVKLPVSSDPAEIGPVDAVILCVKSYDVKNCLMNCSSLLTPETLLIFMQNGVGHLDVAEETGEAAIAYGTTTEGANLAGPGSVIHAGKGLTQLGFLGDEGKKARKTLENIVNLFRKAGLNTRISDTILSQLWTKLMVNTGINGLTATLGCKNGELLTLPGATEKLEKLVSEAQAIAEALDINVPENSVEITRDVCSKTSDNISSMLQDIRKQRRTEIDAINGAVVAAGEKTGIETPENRRLVEQVKALEKNFS